MQLIASAKMRQTYLIRGNCMKTLDLSGTWRLRAEFTDTGIERFTEVLERPEGTFLVDLSQHQGFTADNDSPFPSMSGTIPARVPCDVLTALGENGLIGEPLEGTNTRNLLWTAKLSWWFMRDFDVDEDLLFSDEVRLFIEVLDYSADIVINGRITGHHENAFRPFSADVRSALRPGRNTIVIRLTSGLETHSSHDSLQYYSNSDFALYNRRVYLRKPQFTYGWDWCPPLPTCGIGRAIRLEGRKGADIEAFRADTLSVAKDRSRASLVLSFEIWKTEMMTARDAVLEWALTAPDGRLAASGAEPLYLAGGINFVSIPVDVADPLLWWPNGYGPQELYTVTAEVRMAAPAFPVVPEFPAPAASDSGAGPGSVTEEAEIVSRMRPRRIGIRTLVLDQSKLDADSRRFDFVVNGVRVFCKGGNWVPTDSVYLRAAPKRYRHILAEAKAQHFTMLRVWGGGLYEPDCFYEYCSEMGILLMHDFMYSCGMYPDHLESFAHEAQMEAEYQVRRLASYPCMAVWTGNNEIAESWTDWWPGDRRPARTYGSRIFNDIQPRAVRAYAPLTPYMPSTPYFGALTPNVAAGNCPGMSATNWGKNANNPLTGDVHAWTYFGRDKETGFDFTYELEAFDRIPARFSSEYGFFGTMIKSSMDRAVGHESYGFDDPAFLHHGERQNKRENILRSLNTHLVGTDGISMERYLALGSVVQGMIYADMAEGMRAKRKASFYCLKRAFAPRKLILRHPNAARPKGRAGASGAPAGGAGTDGIGRDADGALYSLPEARAFRIPEEDRFDESVVLTAINETPEPVDCVVHYGYARFGDTAPEDMGTFALKLGPHSRRDVTLTIPGDREAGYAYAYAGNGSFEPVTDLRAYYRRYAFAESRPEIVSAESAGAAYAVTVRAEVFTPIVVLSCPDDRTRFSDNYFPLLPGEERTVKVEEETEPEEIRVCALMPERWSRP